MSNGEIGWIDNAVNQADKPAFSGMQIEFVDINSFAGFSFRVSANE